MFPMFTIFASQTMSTDYFETFQSLRITNMMISAQTKVFDFLAVMICYIRK